MTYIILSIILTLFAAAMLLHFVVIPRLPRKELERKDIVDRHGRVVGVEQRES